MLSTFKRLLKAELFDIAYSEREHSANTRLWFAWRYIIWFYWLINRVYTVSQKRSILSSLNFDIYVNQLLLHYVPIMSDKKYEYWLDIGWHPARLCLSDTEALKLRSRSEIAVPNNEWNFESWRCERVTAQPVITVKYIMSTKMCNPKIRGSRPTTIPEFWDWKSGRDPGILDLGIAVTIITTF